MGALRARGLTLKPGTATVEILINGKFQANPLTGAGAATPSRRARGGDLYVVAFRNPGHDPRHSTRPVNLRSIVHASRFYGAGRSCTPITVSTTRTAAFRTTRTEGARGCSRPCRSRGATRPGRTRRPAWSAWRHRTGRARRRHGCNGLCRLQRSLGSNRTHRRHGCHRICGTTWRYGRDGIHWVDRQRRRTRTGRSDRTHRTQRSAGSNRTDRRHGCGGLYRIQWSPGRNRAHRRYGCHRICGTTRTAWRYGRDGIRGTGRAVGRHRIRRASRTQGRNRRGRKCGASRAPRRKRCRGKRGPQGRNRRGWLAGLGWPRRRYRGRGSDWP
jgi:hypothetical protein